MSLQMALGLVAMWFAAQVSRFTTIYPKLGSSLKFCVLPECPSGVRMNKVGGRALYSVHPHRSGHIHFSSMLSPP